MDHSAYDAYALLMEAGGKRVFYSGDFRAHGRKAPLFERFLASPPRDIDLLLMEGTTLGRMEAGLSERDVEREAVQVLRTTQGLVLAAFSAQNLDRFVTVFRAALAARRTLVIDAYMANLISALIAGPNPPALPDPAQHGALRVFLPASQRRAIIASQRFELIDRYRERRIYVEEIARTPARYAMLFRASMARDLVGAPLAGGALIYSLWPGYLDRDRLDLRAWAAEQDVALHLLHSSGHAGVEDLRRMVQALQPTRLIPIHTAHPEAFESLYPATQSVQNGQWLAV